MSCVMLWHATYHTESMTWAVQYVIVRVIALRVRCVSLRCVAFYSTHCMRAFIVVVGGVALSDTTLSKPNHLLFEFLYQLCRSFLVVR